MAQANKSFETLPVRAEIAADARSLVRRALKASLALDVSFGYPYASLITLATDASGGPIFLISNLARFLISNLARHTANLARDARASILVDGTGKSGDPLEGARITLFGRAARSEDDAARRRFLARHPKAAFYADFPDFAFWRLQLEGAHYIGGFGRIVDLSPEEFLVPVAAADSLIEAEVGIVEHMSKDHADALELYATAFADGRPGLWRMTGIDPEGCDIVLDGDACRIAFGTRVTSPALARQELVRLTEEPRNRKGKA